MPFDPTLPQENTLVDAVQMRGQLNALKALIDAGVSSVVIDAVETLPAGAPATAEASVIGGVLHLSFGLPVGDSGASGQQGGQGEQGPMGEISAADLAAALLGASANTNAVATLPNTYGDPEAEELRQKLNEFILAARR